MAAPQQRNAINLTPRQMDVARLSGQWHTPKEIGGKLGIAPNTVRLMLKEAYAAAGFSGSRSGMGLSYVIGLFDAGQVATAQQWCPALRDDATAGQ